MESHKLKIASTVFHSIGINKIYEEYKINHCIMYIGKK